MLDYTGCVAACNALTVQLPPLNISQIVLPDRYWAAQIEGIHPQCYVHPTSAQQVSTIVRTVQKFNCPFAVAGGGHSNNAGFNNLHNGLTIDLAGLNQLHVSKDLKTTQVGPGLRWGQIYSLLDLQNLTVIGGREAQVGVPGLTLGGGLSYLSGRYGFAADNVANFEVVLADGSIVNANNSGCHADLYKALRGGSSNFGVVTRLDLETYPQGLLHGGLVTWSDSADVTSKLIDAYVKFSNSAAEDPDAAIFLSLSYAAGGYGWAAGLDYARPVANPPIFAPFRTQTLKSSQGIDTTRDSTMTGLAIELGATQPDGRRQQFNTATFKVNGDFLLKAVEIYREEVQKVLAVGLHSPLGLQAPWALQVLSPRSMQLSKKRGGNVLGLEDEAEPLCVLSMAWPWDSPSDDALIEGAMHNIIEKTISLGKSMGVYHPYIYMNYARTGDEVIAGYGTANVEYMRSVSKKYDPHGVFQTMLPGGFKIPAS